MITAELEKTYTCAETQDSQQALIPNPTIQLNPPIAVQTNNMKKKITKVIIIIIIAQVIQHWLADQINDCNDNHLEAFTRD